MNSDPEDSAIVSKSTIDRSVLQEFFTLAGDKPEAFLVEMIDCYLEAIPASIDAICQAIAISDLNALHQAAHTLKSNSASVGASAFVSYCQQIETIDNADKIRSLGKELLQQLEIKYSETKAVFLIERNRYQSYGV
jgi:HPt (histidine-containing phosphotransfer) domain-containing protein